MDFTLRGLLVMATAGMLSLSALPASQSTRSRAGAPRPPKASPFSAGQLEAYLSDEGIAYIRPGVKLNLISITNVAPGQKPVVEIMLTDQFDQPLDRLGKVTPGPIAPAFVLGQWNPDSRYYHSLTTRTRNGVTTPGVDTGGTWTDLEIGRSRYTFGTVMPANLDTSKTLTLGAYARRTLNDIIGKDYFADNVFKDFRPDGGTPSAVWNAMALANSCNKCHDPLAKHGRNRRDPKLCMMCHTIENTVDATSGNTFNGKVLFHKIHMGKDLPSVKAGKPYIAGEDFSTVAFPQDIRNCTTCHDPKASEAEIWYTRPSRDVCGSCHDDVSFVTGANHPAGAQADDKACASCHQPAGEEFDASIQGAHINPLKSTQLKGLTATITSATNVGAGKKPTATFAIKNGDGTPVDGTKLSTFAPILGGPTKSYSTYSRESGLASGQNPGVYDATAGTTSYTFSSAMPTDATGTWTISADVYRNVNLKRADGKADIVVREAAFNPILYVAVTGPVAPRRTAVVSTNCNQCHETLALHGGSRRNTEECVICHNPTNSDSARRPASAGPPESISFQRHIHRIHTGENLTQDWTVYGFGGSANNFNEVRFPGDRRNCSKCHTGTAYTLPLPLGIASVNTPRDYFSPQGPATAACLGCHDNRDAAAHAYLNTTSFGGTIPAEACATCHGVGKDWDAAKVHAR
jgi:OmcA/MtrC family decaheme c-type cytochrome